MGSLAESALHSRSERDALFSETIAESVRRQQSVLPFFSAVILEKIALGRRFAK